ncbi:DUF7289 family protein [Natronoglomus mannanivorans]|uniref:DUF7289 family protein n=1 Tax=Natronoglomus mannanivorans TaxID=2979990 RepID=UPI003CCCA78C
MGWGSRKRDAGRGGDRSRSRDRDRDRVHHRGQTAVLGIVLLIGVVAISSLGILLVASETTDQIQEQSERERVEGAFVELSTVMASSSTNDDISQTMDLAAGQQGAVAKKDTGWISVVANESELINESIGTIEYEGDDGTRIAYQAGGVWRETGNQTQMVSAPPIHYDPTTETFSFPIVTVGGEQTLGSGDVAIGHNRTQTFRNASVVEDSSVTITVKSEYYRGWEGYFARQAGAPVIQDVDHDNQTVTVRLGHLDIDGAFDSGMVLSGGVGEGGNPGIDEDDYTPGSLPEINSVIDEMVTLFEDEEEHLGTVDGTSQNGELTSGTYFADEVDLEEDLTVNLEDGNVTLVVDGNISVTGGDLVVENWDQPDENHTLKIYSTGHLDVASQEMCVDPCDGTVNAEQLQVYGTSDMHVSIGTGDSPFEGIIYAPRDDEFEGPNEVHGTGGCDAQVCMQSNIEFRGSVIASSVHFQGGGGSIDFEHDPKLANVHPDIEPEGFDLPPQLTYLNIFHHEVDVENN